MSLSRIVWVDITTLLTIEQPNGVVKVTNPIRLINDYERKLLDVAIKDLKGNILKGIEFAKIAEPAKL